MVNQVFHTAQEVGKTQAVPYDDVVTALAQGAISLEHGLMRWGSNYTFLVTVEHNGLSFLAIYKPRKGERPLWDFPDGTLCNRETASYLTSEALGWRVVPPTMLREGPRGVGSVQAFVDHDPEVHYFTFDETLRPQLMLLAAFDAIINNADRKGGHCLLDSDGHIWGIDHGLSFNALYKLRTVIWDYAGQPFPQPVLTALESLCKKLDSPDDAYRQQLCQLLDDYEIQAYHGRVKKLLRNGTYPLPGAGPNRPWPPV